MISADKMNYFERVRHCCCFSNNLSPESNNIWEQALSLNMVLDDRYRITRSDKVYFLNHYLEYRWWLLERYFDQHYSFSSNCLSLNSLKKRNKTKYKEFEKVYGSMASYDLFFAQTFELFSCSTLKQKIDNMKTAHSWEKYTAEQIKEDENKLLVAYKMRLGAIKMQILIGEKSESWSENLEHYINKILDEGICWDFIEYV